MFNQQLLILYAIALSPFPLMYIGIKTFEWLQRNLFYGRQGSRNEQIGIEGLMIQLEEVRKQRDEIASQLMAVRLEDDRQINMIVKSFHQAQRDLTKLKHDNFKSLRAYRDFVKEFEYHYIIKGEMTAIDPPPTSMTDAYQKIKDLTNNQS
jgi:hypothetical protein